MSWDGDRRWVEALFGVRYLGSNPNIGNILTQLFSNSSCNLSRNYLGWIFLENCPFLIWETSEWIVCIADQWWLGFSSDTLTPPSLQFSFLHHHLVRGKREVVNHSTWSNKWFFWRIDLYSNRNYMWQVDLGQRTRVFSRRSRFPHQNDKNSTRVGQNDNRMDSSKIIHSAHH
jgi:hypothetical protein